LAALEMVVSTSGNGQFPEDERILIRSATERIRDIANELLNKHRTVNLDAAERNQSQMISALLESIVAEKRTQYRSNSKVTIRSLVTPESFGLFAAVNPSDFKRVISNLVNNAIEATEVGEISIHLCKRQDEAIIEVRDTGRGIKPEILGKLGVVSVSFG